MQSYCSTFQCCRGKKYRSTNLPIPAAAMCSIIYVCWYFIVIVLSLSLFVCKADIIHGIALSFWAKKTALFLLLLLLCVNYCWADTKKCFSFSIFCSSCTFAFFLLNFPPHNKCRRFELKRASDEQTNERANRTKLLTERPPSNQFNRYIEK